ncbi:MAG: metal ABC transporter permease [Elusimicrobiota bacterium]|jgi:zinc transport system permease protein|nr:metal ABC transporter permease [Elusimicrobiota bacterium]
MGFVEFLSYDFAQRALAAGVLVALITAALGLFLVLKRMALIGDSLSHVALSGVALGLITNLSPVFVAMPVVMASSLAVYKISQSAKVYADSALGIVSAAGLSSGLIIAALAGGFNVDLLSFLFGSILAVSGAELALALVLAVLIFGFIYLFYNELTALVFDEDFAQTAGVKVRRLNIALVLISAAAVVIALKVAGIMLVSAMIILPPCAALQLAENFKRALFLSCALSVAGVVLGVYAAFLLNLPSGAVIILIDLLILALCAGVKKYAFKKRILTKAD